jgi:hypothetical protein|nr:MAG TPA: hypothetical protein [Caudoviricetes sp.]
MSYIMMTVEEVKKYAKKDAIVLVATQDLTSQDCNVDFVKKKFGECTDIIGSAKTIANICDEFANQLRVFSDTQKDPINYEPVGYLNTILFRSMSRKTDTP